MAGFIGKLLTGILRGRLNGYKTIIGAVFGIIYALMAFASHMYPELNLPGKDMSYDTMYSNIQDACAILGATFGGVGIVDKGVKAGIIKNPMGGGK